jgi:hypothetical protein
LVFSYKTTLFLMNFTFLKHMLIFDIFSIETCISDWFIRAA